MLVVIVSLAACFGQCRDCGENGEDSGKQEVQIRNEGINAGGKEAVETFTMESLERETSELMGGSEGPAMSVTITAVASEKKNLVPIIAGSIGGGIGVVAGIAIAIAVQRCKRKAKNAKMTQEDMGYGEQAPISQENPLTMKGYADQRNGPWGDLSE
jgi:hypothetical protein